MKTLTTITLLLLHVAGFAQQRATIGRVYDGDTYEIKTADTDFTARIRFVDCPESLTYYTKDKQVQQGGKYVSETVRATLRGRTITFTQHGVDRHNRPLVDINLDGKDLAAELIGAGLAWYEPAGFRGAIPNGAQLQKLAQTAQMGFWNKAKFPKRNIRPVTFRGNHNW